MKKANLRKNHEEYDEAIERYRIFMEKCLKSRNVIKSSTEKRDLAESILLRICAYWESFVNEQIIDCINIDSSELKKFLGLKKLKHPNRELCEALIFGDRYRSFRSWGEFIGFAKRILSEQSNPFLKVKKIHMNFIDEVYVIRNYLSHYSNHAKKKLSDMYREKYKMTNFLEPGQFLLAYQAKRLWKYLSAFKDVSDDMKAFY